MGTIAKAILGDPEAKNAKKQRQWEEQRNATLYASRDDLLKRSTALADRPYQRYEGDRVAGLSENEQLGTQMARGAALSGDARGYLDKAGALTDEVAGSAWNADTAKKYMDPYIGGVVDTSIRKVNEQAAQTQAAQKANAAKVGAFGGDRATLLEAQTEGQRLQTVGDVTSHGYSQAYDQAINTWQADNQRRQQAANAYRNVGGDINNLNSSQITDLMKTGGAARILEQAQLDTNYNDFIENRDWSVNNLEPLMRSVGIASGVSPTVTPEKAQASKAGEIIGAVSTIAGMFGGQSGKNGYGSAGGTGASGGAGYYVGTGDSSYGVPRNSGSIT